MAGGRDLDSERPVFRSWLRHLQTWDTWPSFAEVQFPHLEIGANGQDLLDTVICAMSLAQCWAQGRPTMDLSPELIPDLDAGFPFDTQTREKVETLLFPCLPAWAVPGPGKGASIIAQNL